LARLFFTGLDGTVDVVVVVAGRVVVVVVVLKMGKGSGWCGAGTWLERWRGGVEAEACLWPPKMLVPTTTTPRTRTPTTSSPNVHRMVRNTPFHTDFFCRHSSATSECMSSTMFETVPVPSVARRAVPSHWRAPG